MDEAQWAEPPREPQLGQRLREDLPTVVLRLGNELSLVGHRMAWLVMSQSFMFAGIVFGAGHDPLDPIVQLSLTLMPTLGVLISLTTGVGILAALRAARILNRRLEHYDQHLYTHPRPSTESRWTSIAGNLPPLLIPPVFVASWVALAVEIYERRRLLDDSTDWSRLWLPLGVAVVLWLVSIAVVYALSLPKHDGPALS